MDLGFGQALLLFGGPLAIVAAMSGVMKGHVDATDKAIVELIELALILTLFSDGMFVERELLRRHWSPVARALMIAMALLALAAKVLFPELNWAEAFLLAAVLSPTDPVDTSAVVTSRLVPASVRHTLNPHPMHHRRIHGPRFALEAQLGRP